MKLIQAFRAGFVRRWHTNPDMAHTSDRIDAHSGRVARIILMLHPNPSARLLRAALIHDDGEFAVGDMKAPLKDSRPDIAAALAAIEDDARKAVWGSDVKLSADDRDWLQFADRADAFMWTYHHAPHAMTADGWPEATIKITKLAQSLGLSGFNISILTGETA